jgi:16S rRNA (cytosine1402-N4)-methyltransferase
MHVPVLLSEAVDNLSPQDGFIYIDATFGGGGYTKAILDIANCSVIAFDKDPDAILRGKKLQEIYGDRLKLIEAPFNNMADFIIEPVDGIVFDFGVSSFQLDEPERGFSFRYDGPLDMRMSQTGQSAKDVVNFFSEEDLADIIFHYGDEPKSRSIAEAIVRLRKEKPFETTLELATLVRKIVKRKDDIDAATKTFQALRIFVNNELIEIREALDRSLNILKPNGKIVGVTFHSLEDRLLKQFFNKNCFSSVVKALKPSEEEIKRNPRSRSAKLRSGVFNSLKEVKK